ncbi:MAG TPA: glucosamine-6-phosphate deaminase [Sphaerochaeta sp.]|jgi:glucosamine-6-phosphate deaminase|nr:glucosamine-6-phosphate deaminase [Sphaerochaeta sp.]
MRVTICENKQDLGFQAAKLGIEAIQSAIEKKGEAVVVLSSGISQFIMYEHLVESSIPWEKVEVFHLDEYVGLTTNHKASIRNYLQIHFFDKVQEIGTFHPIQGDSKDLKAEVQRLNSLIENKSIDLLFLAIGENGHIAFNDPPADIRTQQPYIVVDLENRNRKQQVREGWFSSLEEVPTQAISMSVQQILKAKTIVCAVPDQRKARSVAMCIYDQTSVFAPCAMLRYKDDCTLLLDRPSSMLIMGDRR